MSPGKKIVIVAGPNGAGKTTFAREFLPNEAGCLVFVNADLIASGLEPFRPERAAFRAGRLMLDEIKRHVSKGANFAFETTLSGLTYAPMLDSWRESGYHVKLIFLSLSTVEEAIGRVAARISQGGHAVPEEVIRRRYVTGRKHFWEIYRWRVDFWQYFDNSGKWPVLLDEGLQP